MSKIGITDYFSEIDIEKKILGNLVSTNITEDTEVLLVWHERIDESYVQNLKKLKGIQRYGVGFDNLDMDILKSRDIIACNNPDYGVDEVSDTTVAMIMNIVRGINQYNHHAKKYYKSWQENVNKNIKRNSEITIGIIGAGRIGGSVILKCNALRFKTIFYDKYKESGHEKLLNATRVQSIYELLAKADIISIHIPLNEETKGIVNVDFINKMKIGASFINTARGELISEIDLFYQPLYTGKINQVALDVLPNEPPKPSKLIDAWRISKEWLCGRVIINPHTAYFSKQAINEMRVSAAQNAFRLYKGEEPLNRVI